jgi:hydrogenase nickel incorporation protein HypB
MSVITIERNILAKNDELAGQNRALLAEHGIFALNLVSSPGSGKTSLLERTLDSLAGKEQVAVIEGDIQTDLDAQRISRHGVPAVQIITRGSCHLEANLVRSALDRLSLDGLKILFIENVGNLVCPAEYDLGEAMKVVLISTTEGDDKPLKYPAIFRNASALVINKIDLLPYLPCNIETLRRNALAVNPRLTIFEVSCTTQEGIAAWTEWVLANAEKAPLGGRPCGIEGAKGVRV